MYSKQKLQLRVIAALLCATFAAQEAQAAPISAALASRIPPQEALLKQPEAMEVPLDFAQLAEVHRGSKDVFIIHIQDAHSNVSGQQNLAVTLDGMMEKYGVRLVLSEGGEGDCSLTSIKKAASPDVWKRVAKSFLLKGEIQGEEYLNLVSDRPMKIVGIEDMKLYDTSLADYADLAEKREKALSHIQKIETAVSKLKNRLYPEALNRYEGMLKKDAGFEKTFPELMKLRGADGLGPGGEEMEKLSEALGKEASLNFGLANLERGAMLEELHRKGKSADLETALAREKKIGKNKTALLAHFENTLNIARENGIDTSKYENLNAYLEYLKAFSAIDMDALLSEIESAENELYEKGLKGDAAMVRGIDRFVALLRSAHEIRMTTRQHELFKAAEPDFGVMPIEAFLNRKLAEQGYFDDLIPTDMTLEEARKAIDDFYDSVSRRDEAFAGNIEKSLTAEKQKVAFLITGGYHTDHLKKLLVDKGYGYAVLTPIVTSETNQKKYESLLLGNPAKKSTLRAALVTMPQAGARLASLVENARLLNTASPAVEARPHSGARLAMAAEDRLRIQDILRKNAAPGVKGLLVKPYSSDPSEGFRALLVKTNEKKPYVASAADQALKRELYKGFAVHIASINDHMVWDIGDTGPDSNDGPEEWAAADSNFEIIGIDPQTEREIKNSIQRRLGKTPVDWIRSAFVRLTKSVSRFASQTPKHPSADSDRSSGARLASSEIERAEADLFTGLDVKPDMHRVDFKDKAATRFDVTWLRSRAQGPEIFNHAYEYEYLRVGRIVVAHRPLEEAIHQAGFPKDTIFVYVNEPFIHTPHTSLMLAFMQGTDLRGKPVADLGSGSGILLMAALGLGAKKVVGVERIGVLVDEAAGNLKGMGYTADKFSLYKGYIKDWISDEEAQRIFTDGGRSILLSNLGRFYGAHDPIRRYVARTSSVQTAVMGGYMEAGYKGLRGDFDPFKKKEWSVTKAYMRVGWMTSPFSAVKLVRPEESVSLPARSSSGARLAENLAEGLEVDPEFMKNALNRALSGETMIPGFDSSFGFHSEYTKNQQPLLEALVRKHFSAGPDKRFSALHTGLGEEPNELLQFATSLLRSLRETGYDPEAGPRAKLRLAGIEASKFTAQKARAITAFALEKIEQIWNEGSLPLNFDEGEINRELFSRYRWTEEPQAKERVLGTLKELFNQARLTGRVDLKIEILEADARRQSSLEEARAALEARWGEPAAFDMLFERNVSYLNEMAEWTGTLFDDDYKVSARRMSDYQLGRFIQAYLIALHSLRVFGKKGSFYVHEPIATGAWEIRYALRTAVFPGASKVTYKELFPESYPAGYPEEGIANQGTGILRIEDYDRVAGMTLSSMIRAIRESSGARLAGKRASQSSWASYVTFGNQNTKNIIAGRIERYAYENAPDDERNTIIAKLREINAKAADLGRKNSAELKAALDAVLETDPFVSDRAFAIMRDLSAYGIMRNLAVSVLAEYHANKILGYHARTIEPAEMYPIPWSDVPLEKMFIDLYRNEIGARPGALLYEAKRREAFEAAFSDFLILNGTETDSLEARSFWYRFYGMVLTARTDLRLKSAFRFISEAFHHETAAGVQHVLTNDPDHPSVTALLMKINPDSLLIELPAEKKRAFFRAVADDYGVQVDELNKAIPLNLTSAGARLAGADYLAAAGGTLLGSGMIFAGVNLFSFGIPGILAGAAVVVMSLGILGWSAASLLNGVGVFRKTSTRLTKAGDLALQSGFLALGSTAVHWLLSASGARLAENGSDESDIVRLAQMLSGFGITEAAVRESWRDAKEKTMSLFQPIAFSQGPYEKQGRLIKRYLQNFIDQSADKKLTVYEVGLGREPKELLWLVGTISELLKDRADAGQWKVRIVAIDNEAELAGRAEKAAGEAIRGLGLNIELMAVKANAADLSALEAVRARAEARFGEPLPAHLILDRNASYVTRVYDSLDILEHEYLPRVLQSLLMPYAISKAFGIQGSLYVTEPWGLLESWAVPATQNHFRLPGSRLIRVSDLEPSVLPGTYPLEGVANTSTGMMKIEDGFAGDFPDFVESLLKMRGLPSGARLAEKYEAIFDAMEPSLRGRLPILSVTGTAGAGKTTFSQMMKKYYEAKGRKVEIVEFDYFSRQGRGPRPLIWMVGQLLLMFVPFVPARLRWEYGLRSRLDLERVRAMERALLSVSNGEKDEVSLNVAWKDAEPELISVTPDTLLIIEGYQAPVLNSLPNMRTLKLDTDIWLAQKDAERRQFRMGQNSVMSFLRSFWYVFSVPKSFFDDLKTDFTVTVSDRAQPRFTDNRGARLAVVSEANAEIGSAIEKLEEHVANLPSTRRKAASLKGYADSVRALKAELADAAEGADLSPLIKKTQALAVALLSRESRPIPGRRLKLAAAYLMAENAARKIDSVAGKLASEGGTRHAERSDRLKELAGQLRSGLVSPLTDLPRVKKSLAAEIRQLSWFDFWKSSPSGAPVLSAAAAEAEEAAGLFRRYADVPSLKESYISIREAEGRLFGTLSAEAKPIHGQVKTDTETVYDFFAVPYESEELRVGVEYLRVGKVIAAARRLEPSIRRADFPKDMVIVYMDQAFSFGQYAAPVIALMQENHALLRGMTVKDKGAGSGVLSMVSLGLGAARVSAVEYDLDKAVQASNTLAKAGYKGRFVRAMGGLPQGFLDDQEHYIVHVGDLNDWLSLESIAGHLGHDGYAVVANMGRYDEYPVYRRMRDYVLNDPEAKLAIFGGFREDGHHGLDVDPKLFKDSSWDVSTAQLTIGDRPAFTAFAAKRLSSGARLAVADPAQVDELMQGMEGVFPVTRNQMAAALDEVLLGSPNYTVPFGFSTTKGAAQKKLIEADLDALIRRIVDGGGEKKLVLYHVGLGEEPEELTEMIGIVYDRLAAAGERGGWKVRFIGLDATPVSLKQAASIAGLIERMTGPGRPAELSQANVTEELSRTGFDPEKAFRLHGVFYQTVQTLRKFDDPGLKINIAQADALNASSLSDARRGAEEAWGEPLPADYIFERNVSYAPTIAEQFDHALNHNFGDLLQAYLVTSNGLKAFSKPGTRYVQEPSNLLGRWTRKDGSAETDRLPIVRFPGTRPVSLKDALPGEAQPAYSEETLANRGTGLFIVEDPAAAASARLTDFLTLTRDSAPMGARLAGVLDAELIEQWLGNPSQELELEAFDGEIFTVRLVKAKNVPHYALSIYHDGGLAGYIHYSVEKGSAFSGKSLESFGSAYERERSRITGDTEPAIFVGEDYREAYHGIGTLLQGLAMALAARAGASKFVAQEISEGGAIYLLRSIGFNDRRDYGSSYDMAIDLNPQTVQKALELVETKSLTRAGARLAAERAPENVITSLILPADKFGKSVDLAPIMVESARKVLGEDPLLSVMGAYAYVRLPNGEPDWEHITDVDLRVYPRNNLKESQLIDLAEEVIKRLHRAGLIIYAPALGEYLRGHIWRRWGILETKTGTIFRISIDCGPPQSLFELGAEDEDSHLVLRTSDLFFGNLGILSELLKEKGVEGVAQINVDFYLRRMKELTEQARNSVLPARRTKVLKRLYEFSVMRGRGREMSWLLDSYTRQQKKFKEKEFLRDFERARQILEADTLAGRDALEGDIRKQVEGLNLGVLLNDTSGARLAGGRPSTAELHITHAKQIMDYYEKNDYRGVLLSEQMLAEQSGFLPNHLPDLKKKDKGFADSIDAFFDRRIEKGLAELEAKGAKDIPVEDLLVQAGVERKVLMRRIESNEALRERVYRLVPAKMLMGSTKGDGSVRFGAMTAKTQGLRRKEGVFPSDGRLEYGGRRWAKFRDKAGLPYILDINEDGMPMVIKFNAGEADETSREFFPVLDAETGEILHVHSGTIWREELKTFKNAVTFTRRSEDGGVYLDEGHVWNGSGEIVRLTLWNGSVTTLKSAGVEDSSAVWPKPVPAPPLPELVSAPVKLPAETKKKAPAPKKAATPKKEQASAKKPVSKPKPAAASAQTQEAPGEVVGIVTPQPKIEAPMTAEPKQEPTPLRPLEAGELARTKTMVEYFMAREQYAEVIRAISGVLATDLPLPVLDQWVADVANAGKYRHAVSILKKAAEVRGAAVDGLIREWKAKLNGLGQRELAKELPSGARLAVYSDEQIRAGQPWLDALNHFDWKSSDEAHFVNVFIRSLFRAEPLMRNVMANQAASAPQWLQDLSQPIAEEKFADQEGWTAIMAALSDVWRSRKLYEKYGPLEALISHLSHIDIQDVDVVNANAQTIRTTAALNDVHTWEAIHLAEHLRLTGLHPDFVGSEYVFLDNENLARSLPVLIRRYLDMTEEEAGAVIELSGTKLTRKQFIRWAIATALDPAIWPTKEDILKLDLDPARYRQVIRAEMIENLLESGISAAELRSLTAQLGSGAFLGEPAQVEPWLAVVDRVKGIPVIKRNMGLEWRGFDKIRADYDRALKDDARRLSAGARLAGERARLSLIESIQPMDSPQTAAAFLKKVQEWLRQAAYPHMDVIDEYMTDLTLHPPAKSVAYATKTLDDDQTPHFFYNYEYWNSALAEILKSPSESEFVRRIAYALVVEAWGYRLLVLFHEENNSEIRAWTERADDPALPAIEHKRLLERILVLKTNLESIESLKATEFFKWAEENGIYSRPQEKDQKLYEKMYIEKFTERGIFIMNFEQDLLKHLGGERPDSMLHHVFSRYALLMAKTGKLTTSDQIQIARYLWDSRGGKEQFKKRREAVEAGARLARRGKGNIKYPDKQSVLDAIDLRKSLLAEYGEGSGWESNAQALHSGEPGAHPDTALYKAANQFGVKLPWKYGIGSNQEGARLAGKLDNRQAAAEDLLADSKGLSLLVSGGQSLPSSFAWLTPAGIAVIGVSGNVITLQGARLSRVTIPAEVFEALREDKLFGASPQTQSAEMSKPAMEYAALVRLGLKALKAEAETDVVLIRNIDRSLPEAEHVREILASRAWLGKNVYFEFFDKNTGERMPDISDAAGSIPKNAQRVLLGEAAEAEQAAQKGWRFVSTESPDVLDGQAGLLPLAAVFVSGVLVGRADSILGNDVATRFFRQVTRSTFGQEEYTLFVKPVPGQTDRYDLISVKNLLRIPVGEILQGARMALQAIGSAA